jgi:hypothetical protein
MNFKIILLFVLVVSLLSGCIGTETKQTYSYKDGSNFTLFDDNSFTIHFTSNNMDYSGAYRIDNDTLYLVYPIGYTEKLTKNGTAWIDKDGWRWEYGY